MAVTKNPNKKDVDSFIEKKESNADEMKQISLLLKITMLERVNDCSTDLGISRAAFIKQAISRALKMENY